jgi:hypothetical protein
MARPPPAPAGRNARRRDQARHKPRMVPYGRSYPSSRCLTAPPTPHTVTAADAGAAAQDPHPPSPTAEHGSSGWGEAPLELWRQDTGQSRR